MKADSNWTRNITRHRHDDFQFRRVVAPYRLAFWLLTKAGRRSDYLQNTHIPPVLPPVDLLHFWRTVCFGSQPWVVSTSVGLPFGWPKDRYERGIRLLAGAPCRKIIVNSNYAKGWQHRKAREFPQFEESVMSKVEVLPTPQDLIVNSWDEKELPSGDVSLTLVGDQFFRKGGSELLRVVDRLLQEGAPLRLNIVSKLAMDSQSGATVDRVHEARQIIERRPQITLLTAIPNQQVLELFRRSHLGVLVSYVETYGYSVLEAQAAGCPVITTDVFAFPELNPDHAGWRINVTDDGYDYETPKGREIISTRIEAGLEQVIRMILSDTAVIRQKGEHAIERIRLEHSPQRHAERLRQIYHDALTIS